MTDTLTLTPAISPIRATLQLEGALIAAAALWGFAQTDTSWWVFAALILLPDLAMLGYLAGPRWGAICYNSAHSHAAPALLCALAWAGVAWAWPVALVWIVHIGADRAIGYGLKYATHFKDTHLGRV